jgi:hypothetical protein
MATICTITPAPAPAIPHARAFTLADGRINFRACLDAARDFRSQTRRQVERLYGQTERLTANQIARTFDRVRDLVDAENACWAALPASLRAAAVSFDAQVADAGDDIGRREAISAIAEGRPAIWSGKHGDCYTAVLNAAPAGKDGAEGRAFAFEKIVARQIGFGNYLANAFALNPAGAAFLHNAVAAVAMRSSRSAIAA